MQWGFYRNSHANCSTHMKHTLPVYIVISYLYHTKVPYEMTTHVVNSWRLVSLVWHTTCDHNLMSKCLVRMLRLELTSTTYSSNVIFHKLGQTFPVNILQPTLILALSHFKRLIQKIDFSIFLKYFWGNFMICIYILLYFIFCVYPFLYWGHCKSLCEPLCLVQRIFVLHYCIFNNNNNNNTLTSKAP